MSITLFPFFKILNSINRLADLSVSSSLSSHNCCRMWGILCSVAQSCRTLCDFTGYSPTGSSTPLPIRLSSSILEKSLFWFRCILFLFMSLHYICLLLNSDSIVLNILKLHINGITCSLWFAQHYVLDIYPCWHM